MSSAFHLQLLLFTVLGPGGALGFVAVSAFVVAAPKDAPWLFRLQRCLLLPIALCMLGLVIAATHLGTPRNALYVLLGVGRSPLSNEMVATIAFLALSWLFWLMLATRRLPVPVSKAWVAAASVAALAMVCETALAYSIETIPAWNSPVAPWMFWMGALVLGCAVAFCTLRIARVEVPAWSRRVLLGVQAAALVGGVATMALFRRGLEGVSTALGDAAALVPGFWLYVAAFFLMGALSVACEARGLFHVDSGEAAGRRVTASKARGLFRAGDKGPDGCRATGNDCAPQQAADCPSVPTAALSVLLAAGAVVAMRVPFYLTYMTVGL